MIKRIILDTDLGGDCDDAVALAGIHNLETQGKCSLELVTIAIPFDGSCSTARAINAYYGREDIPVAIGKGRIPCVRRAYARHICDKYGYSDEGDGECVAMLRKVLESSQEKTTIIAIGPLSNLANLLKSAPDEYSPLDGETLVKEKVETFYVMGGSTLDMEEFNIVSDIDAAKYFFEKHGVPVYIIPWEMGNGVLTGETLLKENNPAGECVSYWNFNKKANRDSWDPITCAMAILNWDFFLVEQKSVHVTDKGRTIFSVGENTDVYLCRNTLSPEETKRRLEEFLH